MWLAERVWEPALAKLIADAGMKFTLVDDGHFRAAGLEGTLRGYYVTEKAGTPLALFPIDKKLREAIPFLKAWETIDVIDKLRGETEGDAAVTYGDDGEKFGVWPHTKEWVLGKGLAARFSAHRSASGSRRLVETRALRRVPEVASARRAASICRRRRTRRWASGRCPPTRSSDYNARAPAARGARRARARAAVLPRRHLAGLPRQVSRGQLMHKKMVLVSDKLARAEAKLGRGGGHALDHAQARALSRAVQLLLLARPVRRAVPQLSARRGLSPPDRGRGARRARARHRRQAARQRGATSTPICSPR